MRSCRNIICVGSLGLGVILDPVVGILAPHALLSTTIVRMCTKSLLALILVGYNSCLMLEETRQSRDNKDELAPADISKTSKAQASQSKINMNKLFADKVKNFKQKSNSRNQSSVLRSNGKED